VISPAAAAAAGGASGVNGGRRRSSGSGRDQMSPRNKDLMAQVQAALEKKGA
jgi:hypothetical protein